MEIIKWNFKLGHIGFQHVTWLVRTVCVNFQGSDKSVSICTIHKCLACEFGKAHCWPKQSRKVVRIPDTEIELRKFDLHPGQWLLYVYY